MSPEEFKDSSLPPSWQAPSNWKLANESFQPRGEQKLVVVLCGIVGRLITLNSRFFFGTSVRGILKSYQTRDSGNLMRRNSI
jgi:hypothetical protein